MSVIVQLHRHAIMYLLLLGIRPFSDLFPTIKSTSVNISTSEYFGANGYLKLFFFHYFSLLLLTCNIWQRHLCALSKLRIRKNTACWSHTGPFQRCLRTLRSGLKKRLGGSKCVFSLLHRAGTQCLAPTW